VKKTLDFSDRRDWGHDITFRVDANINPFVVKGSLWHTPSPGIGDWLVLRHGSGRPVLYQFTSVKRVTDPQDMTHFEAEFVRLSQRPDVVPECCCGCIEEAGVRHG
jgi:hypothetical protein